jgi:hypothetical protein
MIPWVKVTNPILAHSFGEFFDDVSGLFRIGVAGNHPKIVFPDKDDKTGF